MKRRGGVTRRRRQTAAWRDTTVAARQGGGVEAGQGEARARSFDLGDFGHQFFFNELSFVCDSLATDFSRKHEYYHKRLFSSKLTTVMAGYKNFRPACDLYFRSQM